MIVVEGSSTFGRDAVTTRRRSPPRSCRSSSGKPVRVQFMRWDDHGWDNHGPAAVDRTPRRARRDREDRRLRLHVDQRRRAPPTAYSTAGDQLHAEISGRRTARNEQVAARRTLRTRQGLGSAAPGTPAGLVLGADDRRAGARGEHGSARVPAEHHRPTTVLGRWTVAADAVAKLGELAAEGGGVEPVERPSRHRPRHRARRREPHERRRRRGRRRRHRGRQEDGEDHGQAPLRGPGLRASSSTPAWSRTRWKGRSSPGRAASCIEQTTFSKRRVTSLDWVGYPTLRFKDTRR